MRVSEHVKKCACRLLIQKILGADLACTSSDCVAHPQRILSVRSAAAMTPRKKLKNRRKMLSDRRYQTACHEAAHAVVSLLLEIPFKCIQLKEEPREVLGRPATSLGQLVPIDAPIYRRDALSDAQVSLAGLAFEKLLRPHNSYFLFFLTSCNSDSLRAMGMCGYHLGRVGAADDTEGERDIESFMFKHLFPPVRKMVIEHWDEIVAVGDELAERGELSQREVRKVFAAKKPPQSVKHVGGGGHSHHKPRVTSIDAARKRKTS
jgi:hypothetical protein